MLSSTAASISILLSMDHADHAGGTVAWGRGTGSKVKAALQMGELMFLKQNLGSHIPDRGWGLLKWLEVRYRSRITNRMKEGT